MTVLFTGFARTDLQRFRGYVAKLGGTIVKDLPYSANSDQKADHSRKAAEVRVVVRCAPAADQFKRPCAGTRTIKYFDALLCGAWILSPEWIQRSQEQGRWLPEDNFQISGDGIGDGGPARLRLSGPSLFEGLLVCFDETSYLGGQREKDDEKGPSTAELTRLASRGGAIVLANTSARYEQYRKGEDPPYLSSKCRQANAYGRGRSTQGPWWGRPVFITAARPSAARGKAAEEARRLGWTFLPSRWLLDCISCGEILPPSPAIS